MTKRTYASDDIRGQQKLGLSVKLDGWDTSFERDDYRLVVIDPPWSFNLRENDKSHRGRTPYPVMQDHSVIDLPVARITDKNSYCILWVTNSHIQLGFKCLEAWGFDYKSIHTWVKVSKAGTPHIGLGHYGRNCTEHFLVASKGHPGAWSTLGIKDQPNVLDGEGCAIDAPRGRHSEKPERAKVLFDRLGEALGGYRLEMFARQPREGWHVWGLEAQ